MLESEDLVDIVNTDFQKAFDAVQHHRKQHKVKSSGIMGNILYQIKFSSTLRKQS
jgi:hypothetical protein